LYDRILVALKGDEIDEAILHEVAGLACALGATLVLLQVTHTHSRDASNYLREQALAYLGARALELRRRGLNVEVVVREGEPWEEICGLAENGSIALLVMGKHHHSEVRDLISGSETERVARSCRVSVLLIDSGPEKHRH
jgi:nucleotide-binding universal stress UspA family protein